MKPHMGVLIFAILAFVGDQPLQFGPGDYQCTLEVEKQKRNYWVHVPPKYDRAVHMPVVIALHGATMSAKDMEGFSGLNKKADAAGFIVVYPSGTGPSSRLLTWNSGFAPLVAAGKPNDVRFISRVLDDLETCLTIDKERIYATGMSNGAMMCYRLAAELSERIAAIAPVAGTMPVPKYEPKFPVPVLHIHGTADMLVPFEGSSSRISAFMQFRSVADTIDTCVTCNGCSGEPKITDLPPVKDRFKVTRKAFAGGKDGAEVILYVVQDGGHTWPGRPVGGSILGPYTMNLNANDVIWEFFSRHTRVRQEAP
jgi:polyhydroxybutyrate depolymerase